MNTVYAVTNGADRNISSAKFYANKQLAIDALSIIKTDRRNRPGVTVIVDNDDTFSFIIGWKEHQVTFSILEVEVLDTVC